MLLDADTLEEKVFLMQVFFERLIIPRFRMIARSSRGTVLEDLCNRLAIDDGIHHGAGRGVRARAARERDEEDKDKLVDRGEQAAAGLRRARLWRPRRASRSARDALPRHPVPKHDLENGIRLAQSLGLDVSDIQLPDELL